MGRIRERMPWEEACEKAEPGPLSHLNVCASDPGTQEHDGAHQEDTHHHHAELGKDVDHQDCPNSPGHGACQNADKNVDADL
eukprot:CAMPEP_0117683278 /NCGR_PEP_ID=MMETSP0804-20121206/20276_1 /TAXON_ID=1074897 /ORGANISM="Tetraselmis astigmatica, Strain CCMP880" /LENGTH=81 /DNA_ID=CAMNT_0005493783 /DNA_START=1690 /DNA_END=1935 /DNA_ORIENTATION=+